MLHAEPVQPELAADSNERTHRLLATANARRFEPRRSAGDFDAELEHEAEMRRTERAFVEAERAAVKAEARAVPVEPSAFVAWFESLRDTHCNTTRALSSWLASDATTQQTQWFISLQRAQDARFDDLLALTRVNMPECSKAELGRLAELSQNGHSPLFQQRPQVQNAETSPPTEWEGHAVDNLMVALATAPHYAYQALGALGTVEHSAVGRRHFGLWSREVLAPLIATDASLAPLIAEGALMRLRLVARRDARYLQTLKRASAALLAQFEYAEDSASPPVSAAGPSGAQAVRPVQWRDVSARPTH